MSGGVSVNDGLFHVGQHDLPFGGVGDSGMGHYHGYEGFVTFSKMRPVFYQAPFSAVKFLWPPYGKFATKYLHFLTKKAPAGPAQNRAAPCRRYWRRLRL